MKALDNYVCEGQISIFDWLSPDTWSGKTYQEPSVQTKEKISDASSKKQRKSQIKTPLFLDLRGGAGHLQAVSWVMGGVLLGEYTMHSFGECPREENVSLLSQILEDNPPQKYCLSEKACQGILNRANKRGKKLPEILEQALIRQSASKNELESQGGGKGILIQNEHTGALSTLNNQSVCYGICSYASNSMKSSNPNSGIYEADTCRTFDLNGGSPACNQGGMAIVQGVFEGNGSRPSHKGDGISEDDISYTLNSTEQHGVIYSLGHDIRSARFTDDEITDPLTATDYKDPIKINAPVKTYQNVTGCLDCGITKGTGNQLANQDMFIANPSVVRRLTPLECERLQGYPDGWTDIGEWTDSKGKLHKDTDSPRYKALGNSIALPFWEWMAVRMRAYLSYPCTMASLFDGIGGFPLVFSRCGVKPVWASEIEEFPIAVTKIRFPEEENEGTIRTVSEKEKVNL